MQIRAWLAWGVLLGACSDGGGTQGAFEVDDSSSTVAPDAGQGASDDEPPADDDASGDVNVGGQADGGAGGGADGTGSGDAAAGPLDQVGEYITCKPEELNPILDCTTNVCPMQSDPVALLGCLVEDCGKLVDAVNPKCRDCVVAGVAQDTAGLIESCLDTTSLTGADDAGTGFGLPF